MRVGIDLLSETGRPGGIATYTRELLGRLARLGSERPEIGLEIVVLAPLGLELDPSIRDLVEVKRAPVPALVAPARRALQHALLPRLARVAGVDLVHSINNVLPAGLGCAGVVTVHDLSPFCAPGRFGRAKESYLRRWVPSSVRRADAVISVSEATRDHILFWVPDADERRIHVIPNGVSARFQPERNAEIEKSLRCRHALPASFFLQVGLIEPGKNLEMTSRAMARLVVRGLDVHLVVVGRATRHLAELVRLWGQLGIRERVHPLGEVSSDALPELYRMARGFVFPSLCEGFGIPVLEAFASGAPCVTSTTSSLPELAGRAALTVPPRDLESLTLALGRIWEDESLRRVLSSRGLRRVRAFDWDRTARETLDVYRRALGFAPIESATPPVRTERVPVLV